MSSPLYNAMHGNSGQNNDMLGVISRFKKFKQTFQGDPQQAVMQMVNSGNISQQQLNQFQQMANQLRGILK